ncbi:glycosyltransferase [Paenibacillus alkaliterrae]|uniref:glycosyltransferase family 2 protein n=1 Tax=Paenibacillus alkaliterrae TaxID=320909 RepID=UPI001F3EA9A2|nr:glycosyltransferase [Paenibacillus alkaliterrae]MCF2938577.1 glycosyltransferase [Paenibacillus alkaliterrae]
MSKQRKPSSQRNVSSVQDHNRSKTPRVSVIIPVYNEVRTLAGVIRQAYRVHRHTEVIVVANGTTDGSKEAAARLGARVITFNHPLGHDVGRSIGAMEAKGDIILFLDGDFIIPVREFIPLVKAVEKGVDVALNSYNGITSVSNVHRVVLAKHALNAILSRMDLNGASMTTIPHAISRKALDIIGAENLAVPPLAQAIAAQRGLLIKATRLIQVGLRNRSRVRRREKGLDPVGDLIIGDHLEAIHWLTDFSGVRGNLPDLLRIREMMR